MTSQSSRRPYKAWSNAELDAMTGDSEPEPDTQQRTFFGKQTIHHQPGGRVITHTMRGG